MNHKHSPTGRRVREPELQQLPNPKGWDEPGMQPINWAERRDEQLAANHVLCQLPNCVLYGTEKAAKGSGCMCDLQSMTDEQLEEVFQAWLHASTKPQNLAIYRALLKDRIEEMVERGHQHDLRRA